MNRLPRVALGTLSQDIGHQWMVWAFVNVLEQSGLQVQPFLSQSRFGCPNATLSAEGPYPRQLDSWLMQVECCRELFVHGTKSADLAVVIGQYGGRDGGRMVGSRFETLCEWLDLPQLGIVDASSWNVCVPPLIPAELDGFLLNNVSDAATMCRLQTELESQFDLPVLGTLIIPEQVRALLPDPTTIEKPSESLTERLGNWLAPRLRLDQVLDMAVRRAIPTVSRRLFPPPMPTSNPLNIAMAYDDAFHCYFADTLDMLETLGANVNVFSPLRTECLPAGTDVVYVGCGRPDRYADQLAANACIKESIRRHVQSGGRVYAECAGFAYLCREIRLANGETRPMVGLVDALACQNVDPQPPYPVEFTTSRESWLFSRREHVRGYLNSRWIIEPMGQFDSHSSEVEHSHDLIGNYQVVGSRVHLNFASLPDALHRFFRPLPLAALDVVR